MNSKASLNYITRLCVKKLCRGPFESGVTVSVCRGKHILPCVNDHGCWLMGLQSSRNVTFQGTATLFNVVLCLTFVLLGRILKHCFRFVLAHEHESHVVGRQGGPGAWTIWAFSKAEKNLLVRCGSLQACPEDGRFALLDRKGCPWVPLLCMAGPSHITAASHPQGQAQEEGYASSTPVPYFPQSIGGTLPCEGDVPLSRFSDTLERTLTVLDYLCDF